MANRGDRPLLDTVAGEQGEYAMLFLSRSSPNLRGTAGQAVFEPEDIRLL